MTAPLTLTDAREILVFLSEIALRGKGFTTECLLDNVLDAGFTDPEHLTAAGADPEAYYKGAPNAWATYHIRQWKRVYTVSGGPGVERRVHLVETP